MRFYKYQATGNDFVLVDNRAGNLSFSNEQISTICDRRFGIGADGLILLGKDPKADFSMVYHNRDGSQSFCGNGCRAIAHFAHKLGVVKDNFTFMAHDGLHNGHLLPDGTVRISLADVNVIESKGDDYYINTGTDHHVRFVKNLATYPVFDEGKKVRYSELYRPKGTNVDFVEVNADNSVSFRIYERGVEDETFSSGSGATACGLAVAYKLGHPSPISLKARGGLLRIEFRAGQNGTFSDIHFTGPVQLVFETESQF
jgi:diaminopimelate epimerase